MWADAVDLIDRVQRLHQQSFAPMRGARGMAAWEPPVDMIETEDAVMVLVALPGVDLDHTEAVIEEGGEGVAGGDRQRDAGRDWSGNVDGILRLWIFRQVRDGGWFVHGVFA